VGSISGVTITCNPSAINTSQTSNCTPNVTGTGSYDSTVTLSASSGSLSEATTSNGQPPVVYTPSGAGTVIVTATSKQDPGKSAQATITVSAPLSACSGSECPSCSIPALDASPSSIVVPESSNLQYYCKHVTSCSLTGSDSTTYSSIIYPDPAYPGTPIPTIIASGTQSISPSVTTVYTLSCTNANYSGSSASVSSSVEVSVGGSGRCEQNPNGVGCPGQ
jgi:hypothetical protein